MWISLHPFCLKMQKLLRDYTTLAVKTQEEAVEEEVSATTLAVVDILALLMCDSTHSDIGLLVLFFFSGYYLSSHGICPVLPCAISYCHP